MRHLLEHHDRKKLFWLTITAGFIAASYAILRPFKISLFFQLVGKQYYPISKLLMIIIAIPAVAWYSKLVDFFKRHTILYILFSSYFLLGLILAYLLAHPTLGLANTHQSPYRLVGWFYTISMDFYPTFVIGAFWAFINSISTPHFAKNGYSTIYASIKIGSIIATGISFLLLYKVMESINIIPILIAIASLLTLISIFFIAKIIKTVPSKYLTGYQSITVTKKKEKKGALGIIEGIKFILTKPYVFGIFLLFYFYEVIYTIIEYQATILLSSKTNNCATYMNSMLFLSATISQIIGLIFVFFITTPLLRFVKLKYTLMIMPTITALLVLTIVIHPSLLSIIIVMSLLTACNFSINSPAKEMLFIPTIKEIQFKSKAWIDSFGRSISKSSGSTVNMIFYHAAPSFFLLFNTVFSLIITAIWAVTAYFMGETYKKTIDKKSIIGNKSTDS